MVTALALLIVVSVLLGLLKPEERGRVGRAFLAWVHRAAREATAGAPGGEPLNDLLRARTRWAVVTPLLIALNTWILLRMAFDPGPIADPKTIVNWGGNVALRTTNGEWWRLLASSFVHSGMPHLVAMIAGLVPLGFFLERAVGPLVFLETYVAAAAVAAVVSLWMTPAVNVSFGASGAVFGIYGLLFASLAACIAGGAARPIPLGTLKRTGIAAAIFFAYSFFTDALGTTSELAGFATGFIGGLVAVRDIAEYKPPVRRTASVTAVTILLAIIGAVPLRGVADVAPEIARVVAIEERTTQVYDAAVTRFRKHRITEDALARVIHESIIGELRSARGRLDALQGVPPEHRPLVAAAQDYVRLREESWTRRAEGLLQSKPRVLQEAEISERAALEALRKLRPGH